MRWGSIGLWLLGMLLMAVACSGGGDGPEIHLTPSLFADSLSLYPNPVDPGSPVTFWVGWEDGDADFADAVVRVRRVNDYEESIDMTVENLVIEGQTRGVLFFTVTVGEDDQGTYYVSAEDEAGHVSKEVSEYLLVNAPHPGADDETAND